MSNDTKSDIIFEKLKTGTIIWIITIVIIAAWTISPEVSKYDGFSDFFVKTEFKNFNNWGDFFAGFFAPLAFAWIGYGIYIQRQEFSKLSTSVNAQVAVMKQNSTQVETQTSQMEKQINLIMSQDLANWYGKYSGNMSKLYNIDLNELDQKFASISEYRSTVAHFESLENILNYNNQIEKYFFLNGKVEMQEIVEMLKIDYDVIHRKKINITKILYIKIAILKNLKNKYHTLPIDLPENININNFISESLEEKINTLIQSTSKTTADDIATVVFDNITTDEEIILTYIKVKDNG